MTFEKKADAARVKRQKYFADKEEQTNNTSDEEADDGDSDFPDDVEFPNDGDDDDDLGE